MTQQSDLAVFIGRFQPFHLGHHHALMKGLEIAKDVLVLIGDTGGPRGLKNPWTFEERRDMIRAALTPEQNKRVAIDYAIDHPSNTDWQAQVQEIVSIIVEEAGADPKKVVLIGHEKDASSFYLLIFPQWKHIDTGYDELPGGLLRKYDATAIRKLIFGNELHYATGLLHSNVLEFIVKHRKNLPELYSNLEREHEFIAAYRKSWQSAPFPPVFVTTDCVVVQSGHILLIQRGQAPGKGLWALPGGFLDQTETIEQCAIRELVEETNIKLQPEVLLRCIETVKVFDRAGGVSQEDRGRIITHVHLIKLDDTKPLPKVTGGDDAAIARWIPLGEINYREIFSDHGQIIQSMLGKL